MSQSSSPPTAPARPPLRRRRFAVPLGMAVSIVLILAGDRVLRARQDLVQRLGEGDVQVIIPFAEHLQERIDLKTTWNDLHTRVAAAQASGDAPGFYASSYELAAFMGREIGAEDPRRRRVLQAIIAFAPEAPEAIEAYWALLTPAWKPLLRADYPGYTQVLIATARAGAPEEANIQMLDRLARVMQELDEPALELTALRELRSRSGVTLATDASLRRLATILPADDPDRAALQADLARFEQHRQRLTAAAEWYGAFGVAVARARGTAGANADELLRLRAEAPDWPMNPFFASADAEVIDALLRAGRLAEAEQQRIALAQAEYGDLEEAVAIASDLVEAATRPDAPPRTGPAPRAPDVSAIAFHRWRGLLALDRSAEAATAAEHLAGNDRTVAAAITQEQARTTGELARLTPLTQLQRRTHDLPPELAGAGEAWYTRLNLRPAGRAVPAEITAAVELWLSADKLLLVVHADEPRALPPAAGPGGRRETPSGEESFEIILNPDRWFDFQYIVTVDRAGGFSDGLMVNHGTLDRRRYRVERGEPIVEEASAQPTDRGWSARVVMPRERVFPAGSPGIRFNVRRMRHITERGQRIAQHYTWSPRAPSGEQRPEQLGWVLMTVP